MLWVTRQANRQNKSLEALTKWLIILVIGLQVSTAAAGDLIYRSGFELQSPLPTLVEVQRITDPGTVNSDVFGSSVAVEGDLLVAGAYSIASEQFPRPPGKAQLFRKDANDDWLPLGTLAASDESDNNEFGCGVAMSQERIAVTACGARAVYVFQPTGPDEWTEVAKLPCPNECVNEQFQFVRRFGMVMAMDGDWLAVGSDNAEVNGVIAGLVYLYRRDNIGDWVSGPVLSGDLDSGQSFGFSLAMDSDWLLVGDPGDEETEEAAGAAYAFQRDGAQSWVRRAKLLANDGELFDAFGSSLALDGGTAIIGAPVDNLTGPIVGSAYLFERDDSGAWLQKHKLQPFEGSLDSGFGSAVAIQGGQVLVTDRQFVLDSAAYVYQQGALGGWTPIWKLTPSITTGDYAQAAFVADGQYLMGGPGFDPEVGSIFVFQP